MGVGGGLLLITIQAALSDHHGERRAVALTEANVAASVAYVVLIGGLSLAAATGAGWRAALLASLALPLALWWGNRRLAIEAPPAEVVEGGRLAGVFWVAAAMLFFTTAAEWCVTAWGASFVEDAAGVSVDAAVALMIGYFGGVVVGRTSAAGSPAATSPQRLLALRARHRRGRASRCSGRRPARCRRWSASRLLGVGLGNLFPLGLAVTVGLVPDRAVLASGRAVLSGSAAVLLAPLTVGALADATSLTAALAIVPLTLALAAAALTFVRRSILKGTVPFRVRTRRAHAGGRRRAGRG